jgi:hypothetical protein
VGLVSWKLVQKRQQVQVQQQELLWVSKAMLLLLLPLVVVRCWCVSAGAAMTPQ